jgi:hypothetical protein
MATKPGGVGLTGSESSHGSSGGVRHDGSDQEAESGTVALTRRGGAGWQQQLGGGVASSFRRGGAGRRPRRRATWTSGALVTGMVALR